MVWFVRRERKASDMVLAGAAAAVAPIDKAAAAAANGNHRPSEATD